MKRLLLIVLPLLLIVGCGKNGLHTEYYENGQKKIERTYKNGKEDGSTTIWNEKGWKEVEWNYKDGKKDGLWTEWDEYYGIKLEETTYKDGQEISTKKYETKAAKDWYKKGYNTKEYDKKISFYLRAIELAPDYADAYINLGIAYGKLDLNTKAIESYEKAIELKPDYAYVYNNLGTAYGKLDLNTKAIESYEKAIELDPDYAIAYFNLGITYYNQGNTTWGIEQLKKAARLGHQGAQAWLKRYGHDW